MQGHSIAFSVGKGWFALSVHTEGFPPWEDSNWITYSTQYTTTCPYWAVIYVTMQPDWEYQSCHILCTWRMFLLAPCSAEGIPGYHHQDSGVSDQVFTAAVNCSWAAISRTEQGTHIQMDIMNALNAQSCALWVAVNWIVWYRPKIGGPGGPISRPNFKWQNAVLRSLNATPLQHFTLSLSVFMRQKFEEEMMCGLG